MIILRGDDETIYVYQKRGRGRPRTGFDKKAHDRKKAAERRAKLKAEGKTE